MTDRETRHLLVRLTPELHERLRSHAESFERSMAQQIRYWIKNHAEEVQADD